ncbi:SPW repeat domain-containing protein [Hymenobacter terrenus]|uniref:SPW repeat domain-containing protein n=1 Tax=Hymenobacter terrenus TaxID=1629124 RepID=UPI00061967D9|nr:SPW repeat protein [Hymenobacter terrenus]
MKAISPTLHGVLDYGTCAFFALAPSLFNLQGTYATVCYVLAAGYLVISLLTNMPLGAMRVIPFPVHGKLELVSGLVLIASPWLFGFANDNETARNLFAGAGIVFLLVYFLTDWYAQTREASNGHTISSAGTRHARMA